MYKVFYFFPLLLSCNNPDEQQWSCISPFNISEYVSPGGELIKYKIDFVKRSAVKFGRVVNVHEDNYRDTDLYFADTGKIIAIGNVVISSDIFDVSNWSHNKTKCVKSSQGYVNGILVATVRCSEGRDRGYVEYEYTKDRGVTSLNFIFSNGKIEKYSLAGKNGMAKFCKS